MVAVKVHPPHLWEVWIPVLKVTLEPVQLHYLDIDFQIHFHEEEEICVVRYSKE